MPRKRVCVIPGCNESLEGKHAAAKTCSVAHRQKLAKIRKAEEQRRARARKAEKKTALEAIAIAATNGTKDVARDVLREELRTYINREALTEDVLSEIAGLINHAPAAVQLLSIQLASEDETVAQRAAALILKYTMGNPSVAPQSEDKQQQPLAVHFNLPDRAAPAPDSEDAPLETRTCADCYVDKPVDEFVGSSETCKQCFDERQRRIQERFTKVDETKPDG